MASNPSINPLAFSDEQEQLLALLLEEQGLQTSVAPTIARRDHQGQPPLSFAQERLWFLNQFETNAALYNIPMALHCCGPLDQAALERAVSEIVRRHEVLRASFDSVEGLPRQRIAPHRSLALPVQSLAHLAPEQRPGAIRALLSAEGQQPFDLSRDPLLRAQLVRLDQAEHVLVMTVHHIVADGFSYSVFMRELKSLYEAFANGEPSPLPELPIQFADFAAWQRDWLQGEVLEEQLRFWREQLDGAPGVLELPADHPRPPVQSYLGSRETLQIGPETTTALKNLSRHLGVTLFTTLLSAFKVLLYRSTGQADLVVGTPVANRNRPDVDGLIGLFINTLVLRFTLSDAQRFSELAAQIGSQVLEAYDHQELPFEKLVEVLQPERDRSRSPLFQVMFNFQNSLITSQQMGEVTVTLLEQPSGLSKFDLMLDITEAEGLLRVEIEYSTALFNADTIQRMLGHYQTLLQGVLADPDVSVAALPLLTPAEQHQLVVGWHAPGAALPIPRLFERAAALHPDAAALLVGEQTMSYQTLEQRANQLAHHLQAAGVGPEVLVGVFLQRTADLPVALLAVLKAGGAYVPLDPAYPPERLGLMLADARVAVLLTQQSLRNRLPAGPAQVICLDTDWPQIATRPDNRPDSPVTPDHLAYVIYTSGSTGRPKGVAIPHRSTFALLEWARDAFDPAERAGVLASTSICFDLSVFELFVPLCWGGTVILADDALALGSLPAATRVTLVNTVPSAMGELLRLGGLPDSVRTVALAGEALPLDLVRRIYAQTSASRVCNLYGPTEDTTYSTWTAIPQEAARVTIGRPVAGGGSQILDRRLQPVPLGVTGELHLGGSKLARGYLNQPALTAECFIPSPFGPAGTRLYRTGDLARLLSDGQIEFLGRNDHQIKLRGFRIELGEIETALAQHPAVAAGVVLTRGQGANQQLVAYLARRGQATPTFSELRAFLRAKLPSYMVPGAFVLLDALPLTPNGKTDRAALAALDRPAQPSDQAAAVPRNATEHTLAQIWAEVLQRPQVGIHDNFFELGGHSLLVTQVVARVEATFQTRLPLHLLFETPTIADLAAALERRLQQPEPASSAPIPRAQPEPQLPNLSQLSDDDVDALLKDMLSE